ncbi:MAG: hypothetical protein M3Q61_05520 [Chloroflexota bacterium]|nr:hypothetical protein [Chloroflexota bacterium]
MILSRTQARRICYEAERAVLLSFGRGGVPEWSSVPESVRTQEGRELHPAPFHVTASEGAFWDAEQNELRRLVFDAVKVALEPYVR